LTSSVSFLSSPLQSFRSTSQRPAKRHDNEIKKSKKHLLDAMKQTCKQVNLISTRLHQSTRLLKQRLRQPTPILLNRRHPLPLPLKEQKLTEKSNHGSKKEPSFQDSTAPLQAGILNTLRLRQPTSSLSKLKMLTDSETPPPEHHEPDPPPIKEKRLLNGLKHLGIGESSSQRIEVHLQADLPRTSEVTPTNTIDSEKKIRPLETKCPSFST